MRGKKKIMIASEDDVARYAGDQPADEEPNAGSAPAAGDAQASEQEDDGGRAPEAAPSEADRLRAEAEEWKEKCLRARAELANFQRRSEKDRTEALRYANAGLVKALLPMLDDLERVIASAADGQGTAETVADGVKLVLENCLKMLRDASVTPIEAQGQAFDPAVHEAMMQQPSADHEDKTVLQELAKGYRLHDRVLRPARVIVSQRVDESQAADGS